MKSSQDTKREWWRQFCSWCCALPPNPTSPLQPWTLRSSSPVTRTAEHLENKERSYHSHLPPAERIYLLSATIKGKGMPMVWKQSLFKPCQQFLPPLNVPQFLNAYLLLRPTANQKMAAVAKRDLLHGSQGMPRKRHSPWRVTSSYACNKDVCPWDRLQMCELGVGNS